MLSAVWSWLVRIVGWAVLLGGVGLGCAARGTIALEWDMVVAEDVRQLDDDSGE